MVHHPAAERAQFHLHQARTERRHRPSRHRGRNRTGWNVHIITGDPTITLQCSGNLSVVTNRTAGTATVAWTGIYSGNHTEPADGFLIGRDGTDTHGTGTWSTSLPATARSFTFSYLRPGVSYTFTLTTFALWTTHTCTVSISATL